eukprot:2576808-Rhodomonas_salina.2
MNPTMARSAHADPKTSATLTLRLEAKDCASSSPWKTVSTVEERGSCSLTIDPTRCEGRGVQA